MRVHPMRDGSQQATSSPRSSKMARSSAAGNNTLRYRVDGPADAPALLLSNSLGTTLEMWDAQAAEWSRMYRVIRYDTRGHGGSPVPPGDYTLDDLGRDALAVLDAAGAATARVCGISLGGLTAMWLGVNAPDRVTALVAANTAARIGTVERWNERIAKVRTEGMKAVADMLMSTWFTEGFRRRAPGVVAGFHRMLTASPRDGYIGCCAALRDADLREAIRTISAPALVVAGDFDASTPPAGAEDIHSRVRGSTLLRLPSAHLSNVECADEFTRQVGGFFADCGTSRHT
jgi:3-oxoadipate enol-lactonase